MLVFGASGQLGCELIREARLQSIPLKPLTRSQADIADKEAVERALKEIRPSLAINAAAYTNVDQAETQISEASRCNSLGPHVVACACAAAGIPMVHISTDYVFDGRKESPYVESDPIAPLGVYGRTKAAGEEAVRTALAQHVILRTSWVYSEFRNNFLKTMVRLAQQRDELRVVADQHGCPTSASELAAAILRIVPRLVDRDQVWGTYHFAGHGITTWHGFAERIVEAHAPLTGHRPKVTAITSADYPTPAQRPANSALDCAHFSRVFGFRAGPWEEEVDKITIAVVRAQQ